MKGLVSDISDLKNSLDILYGKESNGQIERYDRLLTEFNKLYSEKSCYFASSSGRVEICGNHVDHNGGSVISAGIDLDTVCAFNVNGTDTVNIYSEGYGSFSVDLNRKDCKIESTPSALVFGVAKELNKKGYRIGGFNAVIQSNVLSGAGISSSASFEVLIAKIISFLFNDDKVTNEELAVVSKIAECDYFGKPCGLLDQTAISYGGLNLLDFSENGKIKVTGATKFFDDYSLVLINTGGSHENLTDEYASIPRDMFSVAKCFGKERLIDIDEEDFFKAIPDLCGKLSDKAILRAIHFYNENNRAKHAFSCVESGDYKGFIEDIKNSGKSSICYLQNCYVATSSEQPIVKAIALSERFNKDGATRVHGGGFAGTILNIVRKDQVKSFIKNMSCYYDKKDIILLNVRSSGVTVL